MSIQSLEKYLPENTQIHLKKWFADHTIHIKIRKDRSSKLGDYRKLTDLTHEITVNSTLAPQLFFFVLTHELAHLVAFDQYGIRISPHGREWKLTFGIMILESLSVYDEDLRPILIRFSKSPKANFMASPEIVKYFRIEKQDDTETFIEELEKGDHFIYKGKRYLFEGLIKKNYLCKHVDTDRNYTFSPLVHVKKCS